MGFIEYYKLRSKHHKMFYLEELPDDVQKDLWNLISNYDKRIGFYVCHTHMWNDEHTSIDFKGLKIAYYVRSWLPDVLYYNDCIPCGLRFWRMRKVAGGR